MAILCGTPKLHTGFVVFVSFALVHGQSEWVYDDEACRTPDRAVGNCISIKDCQPIMEFLDNVPKPIDNKNKKYIKDFACGFEGTNPKVCCPSGPIGITSSSPQPPDVSKHRNLKRLPDNCGVLSTDDRIINGQRAGLFEFPWMALVSYQTSRGPRFDCGGTVISSRYILTAAHCITNLKTSSLLGVRVGDYDINSSQDCELQEGVKVCAPPFQDLAIEEIIPHPEYSTTTHTNDIGLLRVSTINLAAENVRPVCLPLANLRNYNFTGRMVVVTGWGVTETEKSSQFLLKAEIPAVENKDCERIYKPHNVDITDHQICAGGSNNVDSCAGDSGGPLTIVGRLNGDTRFVQQGIVSFGPKKCGLEGYPGIYTRVAFYMKWILDTIKT